MKSSQTFLRAPLLQLVVALEEMLAETHLPERAEGLRAVSRLGLADVVVDPAALVLAEDWAVHLLEGVQASRREAR